MSFQASAVAGTLLQINVGDASPAAWTTIKGVEGFQGPTGSKPQIDVTAIDDTARQFVADIPDYGNITFTLFWDASEATHAQLFSGFGTTNSRDYFKITPSDADTYAARFIAVTGEVIGWEWDFSRGAAQSVRVTIKLSGAATLGFDY